MQDLPIERVKLFGLAINLHPQAACGLVNEVDRLVGQETVGDIAVREGRGRNKGRVGNPHAVVQLILLFDAAQDRDRVFDRWLFDHQGLKPTGKGSVFLDIFAIFIERCRAHAMQLAARQRRLDQIGRIHRAVAFAGADERVHFVDEQDDLASGGLDLFQDGFDSLFKLATIFRASDQRAHVQSHQLFVLKAFGHVAIDDPQGQALGNRRLADARLADQDRIVLGATRENLHGAADFLVAADDRVNLALLGGLGEIARVFLQRVIALFGARRIGGAALANIVDRGIERLRGHIPRLERLFGLGFDHDKRHQHPLDRHETIARLGGELFRLVKDLASRAIEIDLPRIARDLGLF